jgi:DNA (cytosine-5)-methyltransferase 1
MRVIELFAGIGGFRLACDSLGLDTIWANDNSPQACEVYRARFGAQELCQGNIEDFLDDIPPHDLLTGGFPCQPFSSAGKKMGIEDPRGTLFQVIVDVLRKVKPKQFVLENVKRLLTMDRGRHFATILDALAELDYAIEWRLINAMDLGLPQNRQRVFIIGTHRDHRESNVRVRLTSAAELANASAIGKGVLWLPRSWPEISVHGARFPTWGVAREGRFYAADVEEFSDAMPPVILKDVLQRPDEIGHEFDFTESTLDRLKASTPVNKFVGGVEILSNQGGGARMGYTVFGTTGVAPTLTCTQSRHYERYKVGRRYRRLTNVEYARIQGFPDDHCSVVSPYNQYALYGNAVPPRMAAWAMRRALSDGELIRERMSDASQCDLFANAG